MPTDEQDLTEPNEESSDEVEADDDDEDDEDEEDEEDEQKSPDHPLDKTLDGWSEWVRVGGHGSLEFSYDTEEDVFMVDRDGRKAVLYLSDIDEKFYGEPHALFVESEIGVPPNNLDLSQTLKFSGNELVLSRISLSDRNGKTVLIVEAALPMSRIDYSNFDLMVREVATIGRDLRQHLKV